MRAQGLEWKMCSTYSEAPGNWIKTAVLKVPGGEGSQASEVRQHPACLSSQISVLSNATCPARVPRSQSYHKSQGQPMFTDLTVLSHATRPVCVPRSHSIICHMHLNQSFLCL